MPLDQLERARALQLPSREAMLHRAPSVGHFWNSNKELLNDAWQQWDENQSQDLTKPDISLLDERLRTAVTQAWQDPTSEAAVASLLQEVAPGVYQMQFFNPERLADLRSYLEAVWNAQIPLRPPYGIALNRGGAMLDQRSEGFLAAPSFQAFYQELVNQYMRPIARLLFPEIMGYDSQSFGFSIHYQPTTDTSLRGHTDASSVTLNININLPGEEYTGSSVDFYDPNTGQTNGLKFETGTALIHRGSVAHATHPITSGERSNLVLWLYGDYGQIPTRHAQAEIISPQERWTTPTAKPDTMAPF